MPLSIDSPFIFGIDEPGGEQHMLEPAGLVGLYLLRFWATIPRIALASTIRPMRNVALG